MKKALITGITGQDGAYLAELLLEKGYEVHGIRRRVSLFNTDRIDHLYEDQHLDNTKLFLHYGDMTDTSSIVRILKQVEPDEIYNLAAQSHVGVSFEEPEYTANSDALGALRVLEGIRLLGPKRKVNFIKQALVNFMVWFKKYPKVKRRLSIQEVHMGLQNYMHIG